MTRFALMFVVVVDIMGQGLILPAFTVMMSPEFDFLPKATPETTRDLYYGLAIGIFFFSWFFGAAFISKFSDYIGRKAGILICLGGALLGYVLTAVALVESSLILLFAGRFIGGFTAGNQPIAQAALIDISKDDQEKTRNMGLIVVAVAAGLALGPVLGGLLSDKNLLGGWASLQLSFYTAAGLILLCALLVVFSYNEARSERKKIDFGLSEVFFTLLRVRQHPTVGRLSIPMFFFYLSLNSCYLFLTQYFHWRFDFNIRENGGLLIIFGIVMAVSSVLIAPFFEKRIRKQKIIVLSAILQMIGVLFLLFDPVQWLTYIAIIPFGVGFTVAYPTLLSMFSASVGEDEQGWVMGVTTALFTSGCGMISIAGGWLFAKDPHLPFLFSLGSMTLMLILMALLWRTSGIRNLDPFTRSTNSE